MAFHTGLDGSVREVVRIIRNGDVGIGVTDPAEKLEVNGNILFNTGADRTMYVETPSSSLDGFDLTILAGNGNNVVAGGVVGGDLKLGAGNGDGAFSGTDGGDVYIYGGSIGGGESSYGDVILAYTGSVARGNVGIRDPTPDATLEIAEGGGYHPFMISDGESGNGDMMIVTNGGAVGIGTTSPDDMFEIEWDTNVDVEIGRGITDTDITFIALRNAGGTQCFIYPDAAGTGITVTSTHP